MAHTISRSPRGVDAQVGFAVETQYGLQVTPPTVFLATTSGGIGLKPRNENKLQSAARFPGRISRNYGSDIAIEAGGEGPLAFELQRANMLKLWRWATGHDATPVKQGATTAYLTTFLKNVASSRMDAAGTSLSVQTGIPFRTGAVEPFDYMGVMCPGFSVTCEAGSIATCSFDTDAQSFKHDVDLVAPTYPAEYMPLGWYSASAVKRAGTVLPGASSATFTAENGLASSTERRYLDGTGKGVRPIVTADPTATLELTVEPSDMALTVDDWKTNTPREWVLEFVGDTIATPYKYTWRVTIPAGYVQGDPPGEPGDDQVTQSLKIEAADNGTDPLYKLEIIETAATI